jgi:hypothetical protein
MKPPGDAGGKKARPIGPEIPTVVKYLRVTLVLVLFLFLMQAWQIGFSSGPGAV